MPNEIKKILSGYFYWYEDDNDFLRSRSHLIGELNVAGAKQL